MNLALSTIKKPEVELWPFRILILGALVDILFTMSEFSSLKGQIILTVAPFCDAFIR